MEKSKLYFCYQAPKEEFNYKGESLGKSDASAIYYNKIVGRHRNYRQSYPIPNNKGMILKTFKNKDNAQELCDYTNEQFGDNYIVREVEK